MGIVNINDDSFSGDGSLNIGEICEMAKESIRQGADIIDVGAESARTNRDAISCAEEVERLAPFLHAFPTLVKELEPQYEDQTWPPVLSINTWRPEVAEAALAIGGDILNDMGALPDDRNARICAETGAALLIMHSIGEPKVAQRGTSYSDIMETLLEFFDKKIAMAKAAGMDEDQILLDPGIDFAKEASDNLLIYKECARLVALGRPILLPVSRKTVIGDVLGVDAPYDRDAGTVACMVQGQLAGAHIFRVHNVEAAVATTRTIAGMAGSGPDATSQ